MSAPVAVRKRRWFQAVFRSAIRGHVRKGLDGVHVRGMATARALLEEGPVLLAPTHVSYWDALLALLLEHALQADGYALMDAANLERLPFFSWLGAIPVDLQDRHGNRAALKLAASVLSGPGQLLYVFPQGTQRPAHLRPLGLQPGVHLVARLAKAPVVPVALTYAFRQAERPAAFLDIGAPLTASRDRDGFMAELERHLIAGLDRIDAHLKAAEAPDDFAELQPSQGPPEGLATRLLNALIRHQDRRLEATRG